MSASGIWVAMRTDGPHAGRWLLASVLSGEAGATEVVFGGFARSGVVNYG